MTGVNHRHAESRVFISNIPRHWGRPEVLEFARVYGEVRQVSVPVTRDDGGVNRGFAFVTCGSVESARSLIAEVHQRHTDKETGKVFSADWAQPRQNHN